MNKTKPKPQIDLAMIFRARVRERLKDLEWTQHELANRTGVSCAYISHLMTGYRTPGFSTLTRLSKALGVEPNWLISEPEHELNKANKSSKKK